MNAEQKAKREAALLRYRAQQLVAQDEAAAREAKIAAKIAELTAPQPSPAP